MGWDGIGCNGLLKSVTCLNEHCSRARFSFPVLYVYWDAIQTSVLDSAWGFVCYNGIDCF